MAFQSRHRWVIRTIGRSFGLPNDVVEQAVKQGIVLLDEFLGPDPPNNRLFMYYQAQAVVGEDGLEEFPEGGEPTLFFSPGDDCKLRSKAVYFVRTIDGKEAVDCSTACDQTVLYGELSPQPLRDLEASLSGLYKPAFDVRTDWGRAETSQMSDFKSGLGKFVVDIQDNLKNLVGGLELKKPDKRFEAVDNRNVRDVELVAHFETCMANSR